MCHPHTLITGLAQLTTTEFHHPHVESILELVEQGFGNKNHVNNGRLQEAVREGNVAKVKAMRLLGLCDVNGLNRNGETPLVLAIKAKQTKMVAHLLEDVRGDRAYNISVAWEVLNDLNQAGERDVNAQMTSLLKKAKETSNQYVYSQPILPTSEGEQPTSIRFPIPGRNVKNLQVHVFRYLTAYTGLEIRGCHHEQESQPCKEFVRPIRMHPTLDISELSKLAQRHRRGDKPGLTLHKGELLVEHLKYFSQKNISDNGARVQYCLFVKDRDHNTESSLPTTDAVGGTCSGVI